MYCFNKHAPLGHHPCGYRTVDAAGKQCHSLAVGSQRKASETGNLAFVYISAVASHVHMEKHIGIMHIHFENLAAHKHLSTDDSAYFR